MGKLKYIYTFLLLLASTFCFAQNDVEMADVMHESGKIYVVVGVLCVIFVGIVTYLAMLDKKVSKLEKEIKK